MELHFTLCRFSSVWLDWHVVQVSSIPENNLLNDNHKINQGSRFRKAQNSMISFFFEFIILFLLHMNWVSSIPFSYSMRLPFYLFYIYEILSFPFLFPITRVYHFIPLTYILGVRSVPIPSLLSLLFYFSSLFYKFAVLFLFPIPLVCCSISLPYSMSLLFYFSSLFYEFAVLFLFPILWVYEYIGNG